MQAHERLTAAIRAANDAGRTAIMPFITAGYPEPDDFLSTLRAIAAAGDVVEIGIPFSDPMADGMTIQRSSYVALQKGVRVDWIFEQLDKAGGKFEAPLVMMSYLNPLLAFGFDKLAERALASGVCGFIVPDLPYEESDELRAALDARGLGLVQLVTPATPDSRLKLLCDESRGFVYAVTITGITGGNTGLPDDLAGYLDKVSATSKLPVCAGFGIRERSDVAAVGEHAAGAIVGSALVEVLERFDDPVQFLRTLAAK
ncbi:MAG: tryptophan synthase subunit alpha [Proteobacteria bacterium]|nr:tryptophan synthase subunit alpha [Pseudomonadota bacterium]